MGRSIGATRGFGRSVRLVMSSAVLAAGLAAAPEAAAVGRDEFLDSLRDGMPSQACEYLSACFTFSREECLSRVEQAVDACAARYRPQMPAVLRAGQSQLWGSRIGACMDRLMQRLVRPSESTNDPECPQ